MLPCVIKTGVMFYHKQSENLSFISLQSQDIAHNRTN